MIVNVAKRLKGKQPNLVKGTIPGIKKKPMETPVEKQSNDITTTPKTPVKSLINNGKKKDKRIPFDYTTDPVNPNTFNFDFQPRLIKLMFDTIREYSVRTPNDVIISSIISGLVEKFSFFRVGTTFPGESKVITSNIYIITNAVSGSGKDLSKGVTEDTFKNFNKVIFKTKEWAISRYQQDVDRVISMQDPNNKDKIDELRAMKYLGHLNYEITDSTDEGVMENMKNFMKLGIGSVSLKVQEMGDMLISEKDGSLSMKLIKELYDSTSVYNKQIKSSVQSSISGVPFNVIGHTSPQGLFSPQNRNKINDKMARGNVRRFHMIMPTQEEYPTFENLNLTDTEILEKIKNKKETESLLSSYNEKFEKIAEELFDELQKSVEDMYYQITDIPLPGLTFEHTPIGKTFEWDDDAAIYFVRYKHKVDVDWAKAKHDDAEKIGDLAYKVIKVLPIYSILNGNDTITLKDVKQTIYIVEYFNSHTQNQKKLIDVHTMYEENKMFEFLKNNIGEYYTKSELVKHSKCTSRTERSPSYLQEMINIIDDDPDYELSINEREYKGKVIKKYSLVLTQETDSLVLEKEPVATTFKVKL